jgi:DNA-directed RNA polymerase alpha subunit
MMTEEKTLRVCQNGHTFYRSSDRPTCPTCHAEEKPESGFLARLSSPARNALLHEGIDTLQKLSEYTEKQILKIHGIGPSSLPTLRASLVDAGLSFKA